jgi:hypothetical protein
MIFKIIRNSDFNLLHELYVLSGENCHLNPRVLHAKSEEGKALLVLKVSRAGEIIAFGIAEESDRWFARRLVFPILPYFLEDTRETAACFWSGLQDYCQRRRILQLDFRAFNSSPIVIPSLGPIAKFTARKEFILDLKQISENGKKKLSSNHRRNIRKGERADLSFQIRNNFEACNAHARMMAYSMNRRQKCGQSVFYEASPEKWFAYLQLEVASIMQAIHDDTCVSSLLIFQSPRQAYYVSGGTSPQGMQIGAAHFLMWEVIQHLSNAGVSTLNLGGVAETDTPGLARFKAGFGAEAVELPHRSFIIGSRWKQRAIKAIIGLKNSITA